MPDREVHTIRDLLHYQYAKIVCRRAFSAADGKEAKKKHYGFVKNTFRDLRDGRKTWSQIEREDWQLVEAERKCIYCGSEANVSREHLVPRSVAIKPECENCETVHGIHNQVWACRTCNSAKGTKGLYEFYRDTHPNEKKYYDLIPPLAEKKYLKTIWNCHICAGTVDKSDVNADGKIDVIDIDCILAMGR